MSKTINKAMADLVLGLGADPSVLSDNSTVSDYIEDLAGAIKGETEALIDDSEASETKTYSSSKIESLIPDNVIFIPATLTYNNDTSKWTVAPDQEATMKNCDEIFNAIVANKVVRIYAKDGNNGHIFDVLDYNISSKNVNFYEKYISGNSLAFRYFTISGYSPIAFSGVLNVKTIAFAT